MTSRRKILIISAAFPPLRSGESEHALYLCRHLSACGIEVHVLTGRGSTVSTEEPFTVHPIMRDWKSRDMVRFLTTLRRLRPEAVLLIYSAWAYNYHPLVTFAPTLTHRLLAKPFVTQFEFLDEKRPQTKPGTRAFSVLARRWAGTGADWCYGTLLRDSDSIIVLNNQYRDDLAQTQAIESKTVLIPPPPLLRVVPDSDGTVRQAQRESWNVAEDEFVMAFFGYVYPGKGVDTLLRALAKTRAGRLVLIGGDVSGYETYAQQMQTLTQELGISERVIWTGRYPSDSDLPSRCLRAADACVLPFEDGITVNRSSFAAAAAHTLPVITTQGAVLDPMFIDRKNVLLCPPNNVDAMAECMEQLQMSAVLRHTLREGIQTLSAQWFSWEVAITKTLTALELKTGRVPL